MKRTWKVAATVCLAGLAAMPAIAQNNGMDVYQSKCQMCHGREGTGNTPAGKAIKAVSFKSPALMKATDAELIAAVKNGKGRMPAYSGKLSDTQIKAAIAYIRKLQHS
ncbi:MAG: c-type cytochrome [Acidobacteriota bacterium]